MKLLSYLNNTNPFSKVGLSDQLGAKLLFAFTVVYIVGGNSIESFVKVALLFFLLATVILSKDFLSKPITWLLILSLLILDLIINYLIEANHHFLLVYFIISMVLYTISKDGLKEGEILKWNLRYLTFTVLFVAGMQKLLSSEIVSGHYYYIMLNTGGFFKPILSLIPQTQETIQYNLVELKKMSATNPLHNYSVELKEIFPNSMFFSKLFSWVTILFELTLSFFILLRPKWPWTHILLIVLVLGIFITRLETGFLVVLCNAGFFLSNSKLVRAAYCLLIFFFMALMVYSFTYF